MQSAVTPMRRGIIGLSGILAPVFFGRAPLGTQGKQVEAAPVKNSAGRLAGNESMKPRSPYFTTNGVGGAAHQQGVGNLWRDFSFY